MARWRWIPPDERVNGVAWVEVDGIMKDPNAGLNGPVWCPDSGYYDPVLNRKFSCKEEKRSYMRENKLQMHSGGRKKSGGEPIRFFVNDRK